MPDSLATVIAARDPQQALDALMKQVQALVGARLVTLMEFDAASGESRRVLTNAPDIYPLGGRKPLPENRWTELVIRGRRDWVANTPPEIAELLFDHETIAALGCGSCFNMVIETGGEVLGTLNLLDAEGFFTPERLARAEPLRLAAQAVLMRLRPAAQV